MWTASNTRILGLDLRVLLSQDCKEALNLAKIEEAREADIEKSGNSFLKNLEALRVERPKIRAYATA